MNEVLKELKTLYKTEEKEMTRWVKQRYCFKTNSESNTFLWEIDLDDNDSSTMWENGYLTGLQTAINIVALSNKN